MSMIYMYEICKDSRECFAKSKNAYGKTICMILSETYAKDGQCPFCKPDMEGPNPRLVKVKKSF